MVTNEPIVKEEEIAATDPKPAAVPAFSSLADSGSRESGGGKGLLKVAVMLLLFGAAGYFGWQKFQPLRYLHRAQTTVADQTTPSSVSSSLPESSTSSTTAPSTPVPTVTIPDASSAPSNGAAEPVIAAESHATNSSTPEQIEVQEMPMSRDMKVPPAAKISNAKPLVVKPGPAAATPANTMPVAPPSLNLPVPKNANATISELVSAPDAALPKPSPGTVRVSQGVSQGLLVKKVPPVYPPVALQMHREGVVQLLATISKTGDISNVKVISGDTMLARAAADAVLRWKYRPYLLNGNPVEIETQITMVFKTPQ
jgi:protein TonB